MPSGQTRIKVQSPSAIENSPRPILVSESGFDGIEYQWGEPPVCRRTIREESSGCANREWKQAALETALSTDAGFCSFAQFNEAVAHRGRPILHGAPIVLKLLGDHLAKYPTHHTVSELRSATSISKNAARFS